MGKGFNFLIFHFTVRYFLFCISCGPFVKKNSVNFSAALPAILPSLFFYW